MTVAERTTLEDQIADAIAAATEPQPAMAPEDEVAVPDFIPGGRRGRGLGRGDRLGDGIEAGLESGRSIGGERHRFVPHFRRMTKR